MTCHCSHSKENHAVTEPCVCTNIDCDCSEYRPKILGIPPEKIGTGLSKFAFYNYMGSVQWLLKNLPWTRNLGNTKFIKLYIKMVDRDADFGTIERTKRKLVEICKRSHSTTPCEFCPYDASVEEKKAVMEDMFRLYFR